MYKVPPNPNSNSMLSLVVDEKTNHLRMLIDKQKSNFKKKKGKSNLNRPYENACGNNSFGGVMKNNNYKRNKFQNTKSYNYRSSSLSPKNSQRNCVSLSNSSISSNLDRNYSSQNGFSSIGYVTDKLRCDLERYISENGMIIPFNKLKELIVNHPNFSYLKATCIQDVIDLVQDFLSINEKGVSLKHISNTKTKNNIPLIYQISDKLTNTVTNTSNSFKNYQQNNLLSSSLIVNNSSNNNDKIVNSKSCDYECDDKVVVSNLIESLKKNEHGVQDSFKNNLKNVSQNNEVANKMFGSAEFIEKCAEQKMIRKLQDENSIYNRENLIKNIEFVKRQTGMRQNQKSESRNLNVSSSSNYLNNTNSLENLETSFSYSIQNKNSDVKSAEISLNRYQSIPKGVLLNIARIFEKYDKGVNIENFKFIYSKMYHTIFDSTSYGFSSTIKMFMVLDRFIDIRNNVLYTKHKLPYSTIYRDIYSTDDNNQSTQDDIIHNILSNNNQKIVLHIDQQLFHKEDSTSMILVEAYNPSLFFLRLAYKDVELERLTKQMQYFYTESKSDYYIVQPEHIAPGLIYVTSYTSYKNCSQWHRVKILREVDSKTVQIIHVDYGTVDNIPKTELRFLNDVFGNLPCQAIHCCLTGYNELETITPEVTEAFINCISNTQFAVQVDNNFILNKQCQILHVTLTKKRSKNSKLLTNINNEITIGHLKCQ
ncbi:putative uncharacterized protein DDB_G0282133 isoform X3 [Sipha flava]|uniref:Tudor domain-containing protein n=1 Tax=Sipha flava TaxID=143950 RepID=A0A8B8GI04_9HEMI|nr:putative uncharacterized protein DDB_G0282133 isoform X3 [Sipha flava]